MVMGDQKWKEVSSIQGDSGGPFRDSPIHPIHLVSRGTVEVRSQWQTLKLEFTLLSELSALALDAPGYQTFNHILYIVMYSVFSSQPTNLWHTLKVVYCDSI